MGLYMIRALGLNITIGFTGLLVLGYAGFVSLGAYAFAVGQHSIPDLSWWMAAPLVFIIGGIAGFLVGLPCLRLRGDYLAIVTLGFAESFRELTRNLEKITGGEQGLIVSNSIQSITLPIVGIISKPLVTYWIVVLVVFATVWFIQRIYGSRIGKAWIAIREDEIAAASMGIPVVKMKLLAFALSAAFGALSGVLMVAYTPFIDPSAAQFDESVKVLAMVILGGLGSIPGVLFGSAVLYLIPEILRDRLPFLSEYRLLLFGVIMVVMMLYRPQVIFGTKRHQLELDKKK
jgi:branched-chain amino acid transport system permease protein